VNVEQDNVTFNLNGDRYVSNGTLTYTISALALSGSGQIILTKNGVQIGRIFMTSEGQFYETDGTVRPFLNAASMPPGRIVVKAGSRR
jgi:hypothetical protein